MKRILITGENSYIGTSFKKWLLNDSEFYTVDLLSLRNDSWREKDFSVYDVIFHTAGIAHIKETKKNSDIFFKINRDLAQEVAVKAKKEGIRQFVFLSTMSVYGLDSGIITEKTPLYPKNAYGKSKKEAEILLKALEDESFILTIIRPPMVYGQGCKGNYSKLAKFATTFPVFPCINNQRSMIYIDNLTEFVKLVIENEDGGVFFPQNKEYVNTSKMVSIIASANKRSIVFTKMFNCLITLSTNKTLNKVFGDLVYDIELSKYGSSYRIVGFKESIYQTEGKNY